MRVTLCDRCGEPTDGRGGIAAWDRGGSTESCDLCIGCRADLDDWLHCPPPGSRREKEISLGRAAAPLSGAEFLREQSAAVFAAAEAISRPIVPTLTPDPPLSPKAEAAHTEIIARGKEKTRKPKGVPKGESIPLYVYPGEVEGVCSRAACGMGGPLVADGCKYEVVVGDKRATFAATNVGDVPHMHARAAAFVAASGIPADEWRRDGDLTYSVPTKTFRAKYPEV